MTSSHLSQKQLDNFKSLLNDKRRRLLEQAHETLSNEMILSPDDRFDEVDQASSEYMQAFSFRLRGRERHLMNKIEIAMRKKIVACEHCGRILVDNHILEPEQEETAE